MSIKSALKKKKHFIPILPSTLVDGLKPEIKKGFNHIYKKIPDISPSKVL